MGVASNSVDRERLKQEFLELLKSDEEFRLAVAGLIGYGEILKRFDRHEEELKRLWQSVEKLREDFISFIKDQEKRWEENNRKWEENIKRWEENSRRWEENNRRWEENNKRWEENNRKWEENWRRWEENDKKWEEAFKRFEAIERTLLVYAEILREHSKRLEALEKRVSRIEFELGALTEATFARFVYEDLERFIRESGERIVSRRRGLRVNGAEIDLLIESDKSIYIIEIKARPKQKHIDKLLKKAEVIQKIFGKPIKPMLAGVYIGSEVESYARSSGVEVYRY